ncbi:hypothetical protein FHT40_001453 [Mycolicibacterium sp. BK556]|uniref:hypothetical protein n=1 Tax=unclassified Mycolicibacterium TaxID=2636767 RepID=UPI00160B12D0|nr:MULTISPECIES: hypothetical protein [unclassified Mycolicibacterium]MBB3601820.1 hypothetical protein [Mycolicibacterium sp. BK556]MBB3631572.1 hypothetical protein [Mycolicibacterium sp. BK607]
MRRLAIGVATAATAILAGCTPTPTPSQPSVISPAPSSTGLATTTSTTSPASAEHGSLAQCLHQHGVPDSAGAAVLGPPAGVDPGVWDQARKACSTLEPGPAG